MTSDVRLGLVRLTLAGLGPSAAAKKAISLPLIQCSLVTVVRESERERERERERDIKIPR